MSSRAVDAVSAVSPANQSDPIDRVLSSGFDGLRAIEEQWQRHVGSPEQSLSTMPRDDASHRQAMSRIADPRVREIAEFARAQMLETNRVTGETVKQQLSSKLLATQIEFVAQFASKTVKGVQQLLSSS